MKFENNSNDTTRFRLYFGISLEIIYSIVLCFSHSHPHSTYFLFVSTCDDSVINKFTFLANSILCPTQRSAKVPHKIEHHPPCIFPCENYANRVCWQVLTDLVRQYENFSRITKNARFSKLFLSFCWLDSVFFTANSLSKQACVRIWGFFFYIHVTSRNLVEDHTHTRSIYHWCRRLSRVDDPSLNIPVEILAVQGRYLLNLDDWGI